MRYFQRRNTSLFADSAGHISGTGDGARSLTTKLPQMHASPDTMLPLMADESDVFREEQFDDIEPMTDKTQDEIDESWNALQDTFLYMMRRSHQRSVQGTARKSVLSLVVGGVVFLFLTILVYALLSNFRVPKIYPVRDHSNCLRYGSDNLLGTVSGFLPGRVTRPSTLRDCGVAVAAEISCSHVFVWNNVTKECHCCVYTPEFEIDPTKVLQSSTQWDAYIFFYQSRDADFTPSWLFGLLLTCAIIVTGLGAISFTYAWFTMDNAYLNSYVVIIVIYSFWFLTFHFDPQRTPWHLWNDHQYYFSPSLPEVWLGLAFVVSLTIVAVLQSCRGCWFTFIMSCSSSDSSIGGPWCLKPKPAENRYSYLPWPFGGFRRQTFFYEGGTDKYGRPHGKGRWRDDAFYGECLFGMWENGKPIGNFISRETGTGAVFTQGPVGYVASRGDCMPGNLSKGGCGFTRSEQRCGDVMVECSIAGGFFPFLPAIRHEYPLDDDDEYSCIGDMIDSVHEKLVDFALHHEIEDTRIKYHHGPHDTPVYTSTISGGLGHPRALDPPEAVVFVHGWASDMETALTKLSLMLSLGKVPSNFIPIVFGWSCGNVPAFFYVKNHSVEYAEDFKTLFRAIASKGIQKVHVIGHSMGCQVWCKNSPLIMSECFFPCKRRRRDNPPHRAVGDLRLELANVILMNGEALVEELAMAVSDENSLLDYAERLTLYVDGNDVACLASQIFQSILPWSIQKWRDPELEVKRTKVLGRIVSDYYVHIRESDEKALCLGGDIVDRVMPASYKTDCMAGYKTYELNMCIDVIDCTNLEHNAGFARHNYWGLNPLMAEDVVACISTGRPAQRRQHLVRRQSNIFDYLSPPSVMRA